MAVRPEPADMPEYTRRLLHQSVPLRKWAPDRHYRLDNSLCASRYLGDQGYSPIEILRYYYGGSIYINSAEEIAGIPSSWPGTDLTVGSSGTKVRQIQQQLARISQAYPAIPTIAADGIFGERTREAVEAFQRIFDLPVSGVVDFPTWYKISQIYVGVTRIAELN